MKFDLYFALFTNFTSLWITDLNVRAKIIKLLDIQRTRKQGNVNQERQAVRPVLRRKLKCVQCGVTSVTKAKRFS